jgi:hypothetical protein
MPCRYPGFGAECGCRISRAELAGAGESPKASGSFLLRLVEEDHQLAKQAAGLDSGQVIRWRSWHRWSALCLLAYIYLAVAAASHRDRRPGLETGLIPLTIPELVRLLRDTVIPPPCRDQAHRQHWSRWRRHQYRAGQARRRWHAYADATP